MIVGVGLDVVEISRISERLANKILSEREHTLWLERRKNQEFLAGRFALKEAFFKALGTGIRNYKLKEVSFIPNELGKIYIEENVTIRQIKRTYHFERVHATLSHDGGIAAAVIILEREE